MVKVISGRLGLHMEGADRVLERLIGRRLP
jgi:hypothetical protein